MCIWFLLPVYFALCTQYYPMIFKWHLGYTWFYANWPAAQTAEIWGFQFISTFILFSNLLFLFVFKSPVFQKAKYLVNKTLRYCTGIACILRSKKRGDTCVEKRPKYHKQNLLLRASKMSDVFLSNEVIALFAGLVFFIILQFWGGYLKNRLPEPDQKIRVLIVQPNIENEIQAEEEWSDFILSKILRETVNNLRGKSDLPVDFILWPEGIYPYAITLFQVEKDKDPVQKQVSVLNTPLVVSAKGEGHDGGYTNSLFVFNKAGRLVQAPYSKTLLVPFGEYTPGEKWFPFVDKFFFNSNRAFKRGT